MLSVSNQALATASFGHRISSAERRCTRNCYADPGFLYLQGEFGRKLKRMSNPTDAPMQTFRTIMTNAFGKRHLEGKTYSNTDDSLHGVDWPALSFLGRQRLPRFSNA
jgi:hypothetical protein